MKDVIVATRRGGRIEAVLTQQWIVATFARWEHNWRPRIADAAAAGVDQVKSDLFGDLRRLRNDVVHHGGVASTPNGGGCRLLRFSPGQQVTLDAKRFLVVRDNIKVSIGLHGP